MWCNAARNVRVCPRSISSLPLRHASSFVDKREFPPDKFKTFEEPEKPKFKPEFPEMYPPTNTDEPSAMSDAKRRLGVLGVKMGMIGLWDGWGVRHACTAIKLDNLQVVHINPEKTKLGHVRIAVGCGQKNWHRLHYAQRRLFENADVNYKRKIAEFNVSPDAVLPIGTEITARHFLPGQFVDCQGVTIGKGFQGTVKKWNFNRQAQTHGVTKAHRKPGSIGAAGVSRVFPGKKMPGRMGGKKKTINNLKVFKIDSKLNVIYLKGHIPGKPGGFVKVRDAHFKKKPKNLPFPTFFSDPYEEYSPVLHAPDRENDPFIENMKIPEIPTGWS